MNDQQNMSDRFEKVLQNPNIKDFDKKFITSIKEWYERKGTLSDKQKEWLVKIEHRVSEEHIQSRELWRQGYDEEKREIANICARYYKFAGYYSDLVSKVLNDPDYIPTENQWRAMCCNKYAARVIEVARAEPKYPVGSVVQFRVGSNRPRLPGVTSSMAIVLQTDSSPVTRAAKGSKKYLVLPIGSPKSVEVEERQIKKSRHK